MQLFLCVFTIHTIKQQHTRTQAKANQKGRNHLSISSDMVGVGESGRKALRGCIKTTRGPWTVHRTTKYGGVITKYRYPSERERQNNKQRERKRRAVAKKIFAGLRAHGNYQLPKHADSNDLLIAVCREAGWQVEEDGTIYKRESVLQQQTCEGEEDYCTCEGDISHSLEPLHHLKSITPGVIMSHVEYCDVHLALKI